MTDLGDVMSAIHSLRSELREVRRLIEAQARTAANPPAAPPPTGVIIDGDRRFLPGTGWDTRSELSPAAQAALAQLESENP